MEGWKRGEEKRALITDDRISRGFKASAVMAIGKYETENPFKRTCGLLFLVTLDTKTSKQDNSADESYEVISVSPMSSRSVLDKALQISCSTEGMIVKARFCPLEDFKDIATELSRNNGVRS